MSLVSENAAYIRGNEAGVKPAACGKLVITN